MESLDKEVEVGEILEKGYSAVKLRIGQDPKKDAERVQMVRRTFGDDLDILMDVATRYHITDIRAMIKYCEDNNVLWIEEPLTPDNLQAYQILSKGTQTPLAAGENHYTKHAFRDLLKSEAINILQADCTKVGGITEVKKISDKAAAWHLWMAQHTSQSILSTAANFH